MHTARQSCCWTLLLLCSLVLTITMAFSYWFFQPQDLNLWSLVAYNESSDGPKFFIPPQMLPQELKVQREQPFIYQILH